MNKPWVTHASEEFAEKYVPGKDTGLWLSIFREGLRAKMDQL